MKIEQIAADNYHYRYHPFDLFVENQKRLGIKAVEIWGGSPHFYLDDTCAVGFAEARAMLDAAGIRVAAFTPESISYLYNLCAWNDEIRVKAMNYYRLAIDAAVTLGAPIMVLNCCGGAKDQSEEVTYTHAVEGLKNLAPYAAGRGITIAVQTNCLDEGNILHTLPALCSLLNEVNEPNVKAGLDLCAASTANETMEQWFRVLGTDLVHIHFTDGKPAGHLVWGEGLHPVDDLIGIPEKYGYTGVLSQLLTKEAYFFAPEMADRKNMDALAPWME